MPERPTGTVTFLFTDIEGSTRLLQELREGYDAVQSRHAEILRTAFAAHDGHEIDTQGDAFFAAFGRARDAVAAAVDAQRALAEEEWPQQTTVRVRMGLHTGEPLVGGERYVGIGVNRGARICSAGHGGQVLLSNTTRELVEDDLPGDVRIVDLGEHQLKDLPRPERIFLLAVDGLRSAFPPLRTGEAPTLVEGREQELARAAASGLVPDQPEGIEFRVLGPLEAVSEDGQPLRLGGPRQKALLALLLLHPNEVVSTGRLVDELWGEHPPPTATTSLQNAVSALRKVLGPEVLVTRAPGYLLRVEPGQLDAEVFERRVGESRGLDPEARGAALREALALWRGPALAEFADEPFAEMEARRLEELQLGATEDRIEADLEADRAGEVVAELESLVARNPLRERLRSQLMLALYRSGRQADALAAFQSARRELVEELGIEPGPELQSLHQAILRQEAGLNLAATGVSKEENLEQVADALLAGRLVPVLGTDVGGLATQLAERFEYPPDEPGDLARVAQYIALIRGSGPLYDELHALLEQPTQPTPVHRFFAALPPLLRERGSPHTLLVTTSYDLALEQALLDAGEEFDVVFYIAAGRDRGRFCHLRPDGAARVIDVPNTYATDLSLDQRTIVLKLHGGIDASPGRERESFVVTEDDYIDYLARGETGTAVPVALAAKLRRSHFLFLGYGMRDWNLRLVLGRVWGGEGLSYRSWAVQPDASPLERQFWRTRGVELFEVPLGDYVGALERYVGLDAGARA